MSPEPSGARAGKLVYEALERAQARAVTDEKSLIEARDVWNREAGLVHSDENVYEERAAAFLEWYTIDRRVLGATVGAPADPAPIEQLIAEAPEAEGIGHRQALIALAASHRSIFRVREIEEYGLFLDDMWGGGSFRVRERRQLAGVEKGEIFDARLVADVESPPELVFTRTFCVHPRKVEEPMRALIAESRAAGEPKDTLLFKLLRLRVRCLRYQHVPPARIYAQVEVREK